jgi:hypothetical protein
MYTPGMCFTKRLVCFLLLVGILQHLVGQAGPTAPSISAYPNTTAGLEKLIRDMISLQQRGDNAAIAPYLQSLVVTDPGEWFTSEFGNARCGQQHFDANDCMGPRLAMVYRASAKVLPASFAMTLADLIHEGLTDIEATNYTEDCPGPQRIVPNRTLVGGLTTTPVLSSVLSSLVQHREPVYVLWAYSKNKETTLGFFVYSEGAFRYIGMPHPASVEDFQKGEIPEDRVPPSSHYLTEDQLDMDKVIVDPSAVERTVVLHVVVDSEGKPKEVSFVRGPQADKDTAIQSVRKRRFDRPSFGPGGFHPNIFCFNWVAPH